MSKPSPPRLNPAPSPAFAVVRCHGETGACEQTGQCGVRTFAVEVTSSGTTQVGDEAE